MLWRLAFIIFLFFVSFNSKAITLSEYFQRFQPNKTDTSNPERDLPVLINPLQDFEYTYERPYLDQPSDSEGTDIFTFNFKSFNELRHTQRARKMTRELLQKTTQYRHSNENYLQMKVALKQLLSERKKDVARLHREFLNRYINRQKTLAAGDGRSLRRILNMQMQLELLNSNSDPDQKANSTPEERLALVNELTKMTESLSGSLRDLLKDSTYLDLEKTELKLDQAEDAINSDSGFNGITHFEIRQDRSRNLETEYRVGISIPLDYNTDEDHRNRASRMYREIELQVREQQSALEFEEDAENLSLLARKIQILNRQTDSLRKLRTQRSGKLASSARMIEFETQIDLLKKLDDFYSGYISLLQTHRTSQTENKLFGGR